MKLPVFLMACFIVFVSFVMPAHPADFSGLPVVKIEFRDEKGLLWEMPERLLPVLTIQPGSSFSYHRVRESIAYLYVTGKFKDIRVEAFPDDGGVRLEFHLIPITVLKKMVVKGNRVVPGDLVAEFTTKLEGREFREESLDELRLDILTLYQSQGYFDARVDFRREHTANPHEIVLIIDVIESEPTLIQEITYVGNTVFSDRELLRSMKSKKGKRLRRDLLMDTDMQEMARRYHNAGYPAAKPGLVNIRFQDRKAFITITGDEGPRVTVSFTGNSRFRSNKLKKNLLIYTEHDVSDAVLESSADKIKRMYQEAGYPDVKVDIKKTTSPGELRIQFSIQEGPRVLVHRIFIEGNAAFSSDQIKDLMLLRESCWLRPEPYREDLLLNDINGIRDFYLDNGYLSVAVDRKVSRPDPGNEAVVVIKISEGQQVRVGIISFEGNTVFTDRELREKLRLQAGKPYNERLLDEDRYGLLSLYSNKGYLYAKVEGEKKFVTSLEDLRSETSVDSGTKGSSPGTKKEIVDLYFKITEDLPVMIGRIILRGNETTNDQTILRELTVKSGSYYDYGAILKSQQRIYSLRYFGLARFEPLRPGEREYVKDMLLTVEERPAGSVEFGAGYGNLDRLRGFVEVAHRNLWGGAEYASVRVEGSDILERVIFNYQEPWLLGRRLLSRFTVTWFDRQEINSETREIYFQTRETAVAYGIEHMHRGFKYSLAYQLEDVNNYNVKPGAILTKADSGRTTISSLNPGILWDLRNDPFNPRRGSLHGIAVKQALSALGSEADFTKVTFQSTWFLPLSSRIVTALSGRAGMAWPHAETTQIPIHERFYAGGGYTIRGYSQDSVGPIGADGETPTGGDSMVVFNAEIRTNPGEGFGLVFFIDAGNVWTDQNIHLHDLRASYGAGIRYNTPVGPLRFDYGQKMDRRPGESPGEIHINIGHAF